MLFVIDVVGLFDSSEYDLRWVIRNETVFRVDSVNEIFLYFAFNDIASRNNLDIILVAIDHLGIKICSIIMGDLIILHKKTTCRNITLLGV